MWQVALAMIAAMWPKRDDPEVRQQLRREVKRQRYLRKQAAAS